MSCNPPTARAKIGKIQLDQSRRHIIEDVGLPLPSITGFDEPMSSRESKTVDKPTKNLLAIEAHSNLSNVQCDVSDRLAWMTKLTSRSSSYQREND
jgi:hypothetical protein